MTHVTDEDLGRLSRQWADLFERVRKGSVEVGYASRGLQLTKEHKLPGYESNTYTLTVNYDQSVEEALAAGSYDWVDDNITSRNFPPTRRGIETADAQLVHFGRVMNSAKVLDELDKQGLRPATVEELLALGAAYPDFQRQFLIVALGSVGVHPIGEHRVPGLWSGERHRRADLYWIGFTWWHPDARFLAVSK